MRPEKQYLLDEIKEKIDRSSAMVITQYRKFDPMLSWKFSIELREKEAEFEIVKKRIFIKAAEASGLSIPMESKGHIGVLFLFGEEIEAVKDLYRFSKKNEELFEVLSGYFEGQFYKEEEVKKFSTLPSKDVMRAELLGLFVSPMKELLATVEQLLNSVLYCFEEKGKKESQ